MAPPLPQSPIHSQEPVYAFGPFQLDPHRHLLSRDDGPVDITPKAFGLLLQLVRARDRVVTKEELQQTVWGGAHVSDANLTVNIAAARRALGETPRQHRYIVTIPLQGYRFVAAVSERHLDVAPPPLEPEAPAALLRRMAVLPFRLLNVAESERYLSLGLADAVITRLSRLRRVTVRPTGSVQRFCGRDVDPVEAARELQVDGVLDCSLRREEGSCHVSVQLIRAEDGGVAWAEDFVHACDRLHDLQDAVGQGVRDLLKDRLRPEERRVLERRYTENEEAYRAYLQGRYYYWNRHATGGLRRSIECFQKAVELDPQYALAHSALAESYVLLDLIGQVPSAEALRQAKSSAQRALELDEGLVASHRAMGRVRLHYDWDWTGARRSYERALEQGPRNAAALEIYGLHLVQLGRGEEGLAYLRRAEALDPLSLLTAINVSIGYYYSGRFEEGLRQSETVLERDPLFLLAHASRAFHLLLLERPGDALAALETLEAAQGAPDATTDALTGIALLRADRRTDALERYASLEERRRSTYASAYAFAMFQHADHRPEEALDSLERSCDERQAMVPYLHVDPFFADLHPHPRFQKILDRIHAPRL